MKYVPIDLLCRLEIEGMLQERKISSKLFSREIKRKYAVKAKPSLFQNKGPTRVSLLT